MRPRNIILIVADSLRYDSVHASGTSLLPWTEAHATRFQQARAAGCWTLPATAGMFSGLMPHEHGATEQTRGIRKDVPTLAEGLRQLGYGTHQVTANVATTHIFGLERGFDEVRRIWKHVPPQHKKIHEVLVLAGKPRLRKRLFSKDFVAGKMQEDLEAAKVWLQSTVEDVFNHTRSILRQNEANGKGSFCFLNLMETHFPYHVAPTFETTAESMLDQVHEIYCLYHFVNQTWLIEDKQFIPPHMLARLRQRQQRAWARLAPTVDAFVQELAEGGENLVVFCADHGDAFGEQNWMYHFSNVTDGGNRIPLFYVRPGHSAGHVSVPVSGRNLYQSILHDAGHPAGTFHLCDTPELSLPVLQSYWYNNQNRTLPRYRYNQFCVLENGTRYLKARDEWYTAAPQEHGEEPLFEMMPRGLDPLAEVPMAPERRRDYQRVLAEYESFSRQIAA